MVAASLGIPQGCNEPPQGLRAAAASGDSQCASRRRPRAEPGVEIFRSARERGPAFSLAAEQVTTLVADGGQRELLLLASGTAGGAGPSWGSSGTIARPEDRAGLQSQRRQRRARARCGNTTARDLACNRLTAAGPFEAGPGSRSGQTASIASNEIGIGPSSAPAVQRCDRADADRRIPTARRRECWEGREVAVVVRESPGRQVARYRRRVSLKLDAWIPSTLSPRCWPIRCSK